MEFYLSFSDLLARAPNRIGVLFAPVFLFTILAEALVIRARAGRYPWRNTSVSMVRGHLMSQAAVHGLIFSLIAAGVYSARLATIPVSFGHWRALRSIVRADGTGILCGAPLLSQGGVAMGIA